MDTTLRVPRVRLWTQLLLLWLASVTSAWAGVGPQIVQNGRFAIHPDVNATAYTINANTNLGSWHSGRPYVNTDTEPARGNVNIQIDNAAYANVTQRTYSDFNPPSATNTVTSTTNDNTFLLYRGDATSADFWYQNVSVLPNTQYTVTYFASNAAPVGSTGSAPTLQLLATYYNTTGGVQAATTLAEATNGATTTIPFEATTDTWTQYSYSFTTAATTSNVELRLRDTQTGTTGAYNQVAITAIVARATSASAGTAFSCNGAFYQLRQVDNTAINGVAGNSTRLFIVNRGGTAYTTTQLQELGATVNGLSYDPNNGYMYAITYRGNTAASNTAGAARIGEPSSFIEVSKIGQGGVESLGFAPNLPVAQWAAGAIDRSFNLYIKEQAAGNIMYKLDLSSFPISVTPITLSRSITVYDVAYDPVSGLLYGSDAPGRLYSIDPSTGVVTVINANALLGDPLGSAFFDVAGNLYGYGNNGNFYYINKTNGVATNLATAPTATNSDGASCINPSEQVDVVKQLSNVAPVTGNANQRDVTFTLYLRNTGTVTLPNVQVSDFLYTTGSAANSQNVTFPTATAVALQGTVAVSNLDGSTLSGNSSFTGQGTANGAGATTAASMAALLNTSTPQVLTAGQRAQITFTVRVTFPAGQVPATVQYNTAYASNSTSTNPGSYQVPTNGTVLPPDDLTAYDASTNGSTYAPTRVQGPVDSPTPTPVTFYPGITGTVFEDVNYGGGAGRSLSASGGVGRPGVQVELYNSAGTYVAATLTDANGSYAFTNLAANATYTVRVANSGVTSSRLGAVSTLVPVQTYRYNDANRVGGEYPARTDAAAAANAITTLSFAATGTGAETELDLVEILNSSNTVVTGAVANASFEMPNLSAAPYIAAQPVGTGWTFGTGSGIVNNAQNATRAAAPDGTQAAYLQGAGTISQNLQLPPGNYTVRFRAASYDGNRTIQAFINGTNVTAVLTPATGTYGIYTGTFTVAAQPALSTLTTGSQAAQSIATLTLPSTVATATNGVDFGYNFDTVVNTNDTGQGSVRQFLANSSTLGSEGSLAQSGSRANTAGTTVTLPAGQESSIFMIPDGNSHPGLAAYDATNSPGTASQLTGATNSVGGTVATITVASTLNLVGTSANTAVYAAGTVLDATTQTINVGNSNTGTIANAAATTVGTDGVAIAGLQAPEVEILYTANSTVLAVDAANATLRGFAVHGGGTGRTIRVGSNTTYSAAGYLLENLLVGTTATGVRPTTGISTFGIELATNAGAGTVQNDLIAFNNNSGLRVNNGTGTTGTTQILANYVLKNGFTVSTGAGIEFGNITATGSGPMNVVGNLLTSNGGSGIVIEIGSTSASTFTNNTITGSGLVGDAGAVVSALEGSGIDYVQRNGSRLGAQLDVITKNVITNSQNAGLVLGYGQQNVTVSQNSFSGNGQAGTPASTLGIDLIGNANAALYYPGSTNTTGAANYGNGDGPTVNDGNDPATAANTLANRGTDFPVLLTADVDGPGNLIVRGYSRPGAVVEFFIRDTDAGNFGEGQTFIASRTEGNGTDDADATAGAYTGTINGLNQGADAAANRFTFTIPFSSLTLAQRNAILANGLTATATLSNSTSEFSGKVAATTTIAGTIFDDVNYGGGSGRTYATANTSATGTGFASAAIGSVGTTVELYNAAGNIVATTTTTTGGAYSFSGIAAGTYTVRVVNSTVKSVRNTTATGVAAVQTFRTNGGAADANRVGGEYPARVDAAANTGSQTLAALTAGTLAAESISTVTVASGTPAPVTGVDFGFNFDVVSNTNNAGQGSLRQFILNANALPNTNLDQVAASSGGTDPAAGVETSLFMIPDGNVHQGLLAYNATTSPGTASQLSGAAANVGGAVAIITPATATPTLTDANTSINGTTQTQNVGNTNNVTLGAGGFVGVAGTTALSQLNGPEVQLAGTPGQAGADYGLRLQANNLTVTGLAIYGFGTTAGNTNTGNIFVESTTTGGAQTGTLITGNVLGTTATSFTDPGAATRGLATGIYIGGNATAATSALISNNLIGYNTTGGIENVINSAGNGTTTGIVVEGNEIRGNAIGNSSSDGVRMGVNGGYVRNNLFTNNQGPAIDLVSSAGAVSITNNTITNNGLAGTGQNAGIRAFGAGNTVSQNIIANNYGAGVMVRPGTNTAGVAGSTLITQNSIYGNGTVLSASGGAASGEVGIDLLNNGENETTGTSPFVTLNDDADADGTTSGGSAIGGNTLLNFPVLTSATVVGTNVVITGFARAGSKIELYTAQVNSLSSPSATTGNNFGQGKAYLGTVTEGGAAGGGNLVADTNTGTGSYTGLINGFNQGTDNSASAFTFTIPIASLPGGTLTPGTVLTSTATLSSATSEFSGNVTVGSVLSGYVFEDVNYGGGAGRVRTATGASVRPNARVELYDGSGSFVAAATTDATGLYTFNAVPGSYTVRVVNSTVTSSRGGYVAGLLPVQTYNGTTTRVGGEAPALTDAAANTTSATLASLTTTTTTAESQGTVTVGTAATTGPDFGFNFDLVVNTNDAGQGSLRQFITNANTLGGEASLAQSGSNAAGALPAARETSIFMIPSGSAAAGLLASGSGGPASQLTGGVAVITPATVLPALAGTNSPYTIIDGTTQTFNIGNTNTATLGAGGNVGVTPTALAQLSGPEVQLNGSTAVAIGLDVAGTATNVTIRGLAVTGFGNTTDNDGGANIRSAANNVTITQNVVGTTATSFSLPATVTNADNVRLTGGTAGVVVSNNLIGYANGKGIAINNGVTNASVTGNEVRGNARTSPNLDGLDIQGSLATVTNNLFADNSGQGIDSYRSAGSNNITNNTVTNNGRGTTGLNPNETQGIRVYGANNSIVRNVIFDNYGSGITLEGTTGQSPVTTTLVSQNSIYNNGNVSSLNGLNPSGAIGIDLGVSGDNEPAGTAPFVTLNNASGTTGANALVNYPILRSATIVGTNLVLRGYAKAGATIELFTGQANPATYNATGANFGQGRSYLLTLTEGATTGNVDSNASTGQSYGPGNINGFAQGSDTNANGFTYTIPLSSLPGVASGVLLTSTATLSGATSEFSGNVAVNTAPVPNTLTNANIPNTNGAAVLNPNLSASVSGTGNSVQYYTITSLPASGTLIYNGTTLTSGNIATTQITPALLGTLTYTPVSGFVGTPSFTYTVTDANNITSTTNNNGGTITAGAATYTIPVVAVADVATTITPSVTPVNAGAALSFNVTFTNAGPNTAAGYAQTLTLTAGLGTVNFPTLPSGVTASYNNTTGVVTFTGSPTTLASGGNQNLTVTIPSVPAALASVTASTTVTTTTNQGADTGTNSATVTVPVTPVADVSSNLTGPGSLSVGVQSGNYTVTFANNGPSTAAGVTRVVTIPANTVSAVNAPGATVTGTAATGFTLTYPGGSFASGNSASYNFTITPGVLTAGNNITVSSNTTTTTSQNGATANDPSSVTYTVGAIADVTTTLTAPATLLSGIQSGNYTVTFANNGPSTGDGVTRVVTIPANTVSAVNAPTATVTGTAATGFTLTYPSGSFASGNSVSYTFTVTPATTAAGTNLTVTSTTATTTGQGANLGPDVATTTTAIAPVADVTTTVTGPTQVIPGGTNTYSAVFTNNGPNAASGVTRVVQLPTGASLTGTQQNDITTAYPGTTFSTTGTGASAVTTITFPSVTTLNNGASSTVSFAFTQSPTAGNGTLTSTAGTSTSQGNNTAADVATLTINVAGASFSCNSAFYRVRDSGGTSILERLDRTASGSTITYTGVTLYNTGVSLNALAYNYADNYLYAFGTGTNTLYRLSTTGAQTLGAQAGLSASGYNAATSDLSGNIYLANGSSSTITRLVVSTLAASTITLSQSVNFGDLAYNSVDGNLYGNRFYATSGANGIARINPGTGAVTVLSTPATAGNDVGSLFFDAAGSLYAATNQGNFVVFDTSTGAATLVGTAGTASQSDGASCVFPTQSVDVVLSAATPVRVSPLAFDVTYTVNVKNTGVTTDTNLQINNFVNDGTSPTGAAFPGASSVTVVTAPAVTAGTALAVNTGFNGTTSNGLLAGTTSLASNATSTLTYTVRVTYPSVAAIPTTAQNNLVYASTTGASPNVGYTLVNGVAIPPSGVLAGDRSTNGTTLPNSANGDTPSPTPVVFANPLVQNITNVTLNNTAPATVLNPNLSATPGLNGAGSAISSFTVNGPVSNGTLRYNGAIVTGTITVPVANIGLLTYQPVTGFTGNATFTFSATDASGGVSNTATYTIPVQNLADVTTTLNGPTQLSTGVATGTYTVTYANVGTAAASTVTRTVTLPAGATLTAAQTTAITGQGGTVSGSTIDFGNVTTLAAGASSSFTFSFTAPTTAGAVTVTSNTSTTSLEGTNPAPNSSTINANVNAVADVAATITPIAASVAAGATGAGFNVSFANNGALTPAAGVTRTVQLPAGLGTVSATNGGTYNNTTGVVTYTPTPTTIANGTPLTSQITFTAPASGPVTATANVATTSSEAGQTANNTQSASVAITPAFDLTTTIYGPATVLQGNQVTLNVTTTNNGPSATTATQTVQLIAGLTNVFVSNGGTYNSGSGLVTFPAIASLPSGQTVANTISFTAPTAGTALAPVATVTPNTAPAGETSITNNTAYLNGAGNSTNITINDPTTLLANVYTTVSATPQSVAAGSPVTVTVTQGNAGPTAASTVVETVQLLPGLTLTTTPAGATYSSTTGLLTLPTIGSQASGASTSYTIVFTAPANAGNNGQILIGASVTTQTSETVLADNGASTVVTVVPTADVATFVSGLANASAGQTVTYAASFTNNGQGTATNVVRTVQLPAGLGAVTILDAATGLTAGTYNSATGLVTFPALATQAAGTSSAYTLSFAAPSANFTVRSATSTTTVDGVTTNNASSVSTTVTGAADVAVAISGPASAVVGNPVTYYVTTTNNGPTSATGVATTLQLPTGLTGVTVSNGGTYASGTGLVTFTAIGALLNGASVADYVTFTMPNATGGQLNGVATTTSTSTDPVGGNNSASTATSVAPVTGTIADVATTVAAPASITAGATLTVTATFTNNGPAAAINVAPTAQLPAGLAGVVVSNSGTYNPATGVVAWPLIPSQASGNTATYTVNFTAPATGPVRATSAVSSQTSDGDLTNNSRSTTTTIDASYDAITSISGPASSLPGITNTYSVTASNSGFSVAPSVQQTVTLPTGVTATSISGSGTQTGTTITWPAISNLAPGAANAISYTFDVTMPATGNLALTANVTSASESNTGNNSSTLTSTRANQPPVASNVVNSLQSPEGNTAGQLQISPLAATDADGTVATYQLTSIPNATTQGTLYYNNGGTYTAITAANIVGGGSPLNLTSTQAATLRFDPVAGFVGNAMFTYTATDNLEASSNVAMYFIPVGLDNAAVYANTPPRGNANPYQTGNVIAYVIDPNGANYNSAGTIYNADGTLTTTGAPRNGLATSGSNAVLTPVSGPGSATPPSGNPTNTLPAGVSLNPVTGQLFVSDASQLPRVTVPTTYTVNITTTDVYGGVTMQPVSFILGAFPLPVELTVFTAQAVKLDGLLKWTTASEKNNDHFEVERSLTGREFAKIGEVQGQGSKATPTDYTLTDASIGTKAAGTVYYRLKQVDADGTSSYSPVRTIAFTKAATPALSLYPNPAVGETTLDLSQVPTGTYQVSILDATGRVILGLNLAAGLTHQVSLTDVASGTYTVLLRGTTPDGTTLHLTKRLIKN